MPQHIVVLDETFTYPVEVKVDIEKDESWFVTLDITGIPRSFRDDGDLTLMPKEAIALGEALIAKGKAALEENSK